MTGKVKGVYLIGLGAAKELVEVLPGVSGWVMESELSFFIWAFTPSSAVLLPSGASWLP